MTGTHGSILALTVSETLGRKKPICLTNETDCTPTFEGVPDA